MLGHKAYYESGLVLVLTRKSVANTDHDQLSAKHVLW